MEYTIDELDDRIHDFLLMNKDKLFSFHLHMPQFTL